MASSRRALSSCSFLKATSALNNVPALLEFDAGREQEQQRVEVVLLRHHAVLAQILRDHRGRNAEIRIVAGVAVESRRQQSELVGVGDGVAGRHMGEAVPARAGREFPVAGIGGEVVGRHALPGGLARAAVAVRHGDPIGHEGLEEPAPRRVLLLVLELAPDRAHLLAQLDAEPDGIVPQHLAGAPFHHLRADIERGEQRIERRRRGVQHEELVEAAVLDTPALPLDVTVFDVDLRGLGEARELLVGGLGRDDAGCVGAEMVQAHGEAAGIERVELHEAGPGFVEHDVVAQMADLLDNSVGVVDGAVIGALLDHCDAERPLAPPCLLVGDQRMNADLFADAILVERFAGISGRSDRRHCGRSRGKSECRRR